MMHRLKDADRAIIEGAQNVFPVKLGQIAERLGVAIKASTLAAGISGEIRPVGASYEIKVNRHDSTGRQRFTVAHELAHYLLHRDQIGDGLKDDVLYRSSLSDAREAEANRLAAQILMPKEAVIRAIGDYQGEQSELCSNLAQYFGVSDAAMRIRLDSL